MRRNLRRADLARDDPGRQRDHRQPAAGMRGAADQEQPAHRAAVGRPEQPTGGPVDRAARSARRALQRSAGVSTSRNSTRSRTSSPARGEHRQAPGRRTPRPAPAGPVHRAAMPCRGALTSTNHASCPSGRTAGSSATVTNTAGFGGRPPAEHRVELGVVVARGKNTVWCASPGVRPAHTQQQHEPGQAAVGEPGQPARRRQQVAVDVQRIHIGHHHVGRHARPPATRTPVTRPRRRRDPGHRRARAHRHPERDAPRQQRVGERAQPAAQVPAAERSSAYGIATSAAGARRGSAPA